MLVYVRVYYRMRVSALLLWGEMVCLFHMKLKDQSIFCYGKPKIVEKTILYTSALIDITEVFTVCSTKALSATNNITMYICSVYLY